MKDFTPVDPNISMYIPLFVPYTFPMALTGRIMLKKSKAFQVCNHFYNSHEPDV